MLWEKEKFMLLKVLFLMVIKTKWDCVERGSYKFTDNTIKEDGLKNMNTILSLIYALQGLYIFQKGGGAQLLWYKYKTTEESLLKNMNNSQDKFKAFV